MLISQPLFVLAVLCANVALCEWLVRNTAARHLGTALLVILVTAVQANLGLIPTASNAPPLYDGIFTYLAPLGLFLLLLEVNLRQLRHAGLPMLMMFLIGSAGTVIGVLVALWIVDAPTSIGPLWAAFGGMFTGTYTGGAINFNAVALHYRIVEEGALYTGALAADNILTSVWMIATLALPRLLGGGRPAAAPAALKPDEALRHEHDTETIGPGALGGLLALGAGAMWLSDSLTAWFASMGVSLPSILVLTTIALALAQIGSISSLPGTRVIGMSVIYVFLAAIGAHAELGALIELGRLGLVLLVFASILVLVHGLVTFGLGRVLRQDPELVAVASQANIGGSTSALAVAKSLGRPDLLLPAILVGSLGNGLGTYLGFIVAGTLGAAAPG